MGLEASVFVIGRQHLLPCKAALSDSGLQAFRLLVVLRPHLVSSFSPLADSLMVSHCGLTLTEKKLMFIAILLHQC